jgi:hypothetical protein
MVEGFSNSTSDFDVLLFSDGKSVGSSRSVLKSDMDGYAVEIDFEGDVRTDTELWTMEAVAGIAETLRECDPLDWRSVIKVSRRDFELAHRIRVGQPVVNEVRFGEIQARFDWRQISGALTQMHLQEYAEHSEDAIGAVRAEDHYVAMLTSRRALGAAVDALCAVACDCTNSKEKWRPHRLATLDEATQEAYYAAEMEMSLVPANVLHSAKCRLTRAAEMAAKAGDLLARAFR